MVLQDPPGYVEYRGAFWIPVFKDEVPGTASQAPENKGHAYIISLSIYMFKNGIFKV